MEVNSLIGYKNNCLLVIEKVRYKNRWAYKCRCDCGNYTIAYAKEIKNDIRKSCGCLNKSLKIGEKYSKLTVIKIDKIIKNRYYYLLQCDCGKLISRDGSKIKNRFKNNTLQSCGCGLKEIKHKKVKANGESAKNRLIDSYKRNAKKRNYIFELINNELVILFKSNCHYCNKNPSTTMKTKSGDEFLYNGIDRMNNNIGYISSNVVSCCKQCNYLKGNINYNEFLDLIKAISNNLKLSYN